MASKFYSDPTYRSKQSVLMKANWQKGVFNSLIKKDERMCARKECGSSFEVIRSDPKIYCNSRCSAIINNAKRDKPSLEIKSKISVALKKRRREGYRNPSLGLIRVPRVSIICAYPKCKKIFLEERWKKKRKFCSIPCLINVIGSQPTSPKASRGKAGIRKDISTTDYFYSRWEANMARLFNLLEIKWQHQPGPFDLQTQKYTPDFYLPEHDTYIEVKNFWWKYSIERDRKFRRLYPNTKLEVILKDEYQNIEKEYAELIDNWEYRNSKFIEEKT